MKINLFSPWYSWKIAELELNNNHSLTQYFACACVSILINKCFFFSFYKSLIISVFLDSTTIYQLYVIYYLRFYWACYVSPGLAIEYAMSRQAWLLSMIWLARFGYRVWYVLPGLAIEYAMFRQVWLLSMIWLARFGYEYDCMIWLARFGNWVFNDSPGLTQCVLVLFSAVDDFVRGNYLHGKLVWN